MLMCSLIQGTCKVKTFVNLITIVCQHPKDVVIEHPSVTTILSGTRAKNLASKAQLQEVHPKTTVKDALRMMEADCNMLLLRGIAKQGSTARSSSSEILVKRLELSKIAFETNSFGKPLSAVAEMLHSPPAVDFNESLTTVVDTFHSQAVEVVSVMENGAVRGIISLKNLLVFIRKQVENIERRQGKNPDEWGVDFEFNNDDDDDDDEDNFGMKSKSDIRAAERSKAIRYSQGQLQAQSFSRSWCCELLISCCVLIDISIAIADMVLSDQDPNSNFSGIDSRAMAVTGCLLAVFSYETTIRVYGFFNEMRYHPFWMFDMSIITSSVIVYVSVLTQILPIYSKSVVTIMRALRVMRLVIIIRNLKLSERLRHLVGSEKTRYQKDSFDLDLTYVTNNCIAMSWPAVGTEANFRNPMPEVQRFFFTKHNNHFLIFNLCQERSYSPDLFDGMVERIEVQDHNPPMLFQIFLFLERAGQFMEESPRNCIAVHCKGGKGRTGIFIASWLMYSRFCVTADEACEYFAAKRTGSKAKHVQGVSQPSQQRYVKYVETALKDGGYYCPALTLKKIVLKTCPHTDTDGSYNPAFTIEECGKVVYDLRQSKKDVAKMSKADTDTPFELNICLQGDVRFLFCDHDEINSKKRDNLCFFLWFHTGFITSELTAFDKLDVDIACHDKKCKIFGEKFGLELLFDTIPDRTSPDTEDLGAFRPILEPAENVITQAARMKSLAGTSSNGFDLSSPKASKSPKSPKSPTRFLSDGNESPIRSFPVFRELSESSVVDKNSVEGGPDGSLVFMGSRSRSAIPKVSTSTLV